MLLTAGPRLSEAPGEIDLGAPNSSKIIYRGSATLLYVNSYGKQGVVKRETVVGTVFIWEEKWINVNSRDIADSGMVSRKAQKHFMIDTMVGNIVDKSQEVYRELY